jgi:hypothetical protein
MYKNEDKIYAKYFNETPKDINYRRALKQAIKYCEWLFAPNKNIHELFFDVY